MRSLAGALGIFALGLVWLGPLPVLAEQSFTAHMVMHMTVVAVAAPLIAAGLAHTSIDPARRASGLFVAIPASIVELAVVWTWHAPALHHAARQQPEMFVAEQGSFLIAGLFLWLSILGGDPTDRSTRASRGVIALLLTFAHMTMLGALLALTPRPLYQHGGGLDGVTALVDQQIGGAVMLVTGALSYIGGGLGLSRRLLRRPRVREAVS